MGKTTWGGGKENQAFNGWTFSSSYRLISTDY